MKGIYQIYFSYDELTEIETKLYLSHFSSLPEPKNLNL